ncbi:uncharacterized protein LOC126840573 [Adelges cooleyi]|uniref:uncharacterized protein LOC126840573 n=1 Tax=Adelges cooleyi TaxID=133065 RepID=UPI00218053E0|nr:uncharacterized protein LOC126840573 [Adelges cooleyi]
MDSDAPPLSRSRPPTSNDNNERLSDANEDIQFSPYRYEMQPVSSQSLAPLTYPTPISAWPNAQNFPPYLEANSSQPSSYMYHPPSSSMRLHPTQQVSPNCLDWKINPIVAPTRQFKTTPKPLFPLGYSSTISENWMEGNKGLQYSIKNFTFCTKRTSSNTKDVEKANEYDSLFVSIPQALEGDYHYYVWPASPVLAWILWEHRLELPGKRILEVGSGTSLPGIIAAKCGAIVTLTDDPRVPGTIKHIQKCCYMNGLYPEQIRVIGLPWGYFLRETLNLGPIDLIIGSDCFYEPNLFEDLIVTISYLLERNPMAKFMTTYHERDPDLGIDELADKWMLNCTHKSLEELGKNNELDIYELMKGNDIHLLEITRKVLKNK